jgi:hypothetical protein
MPEAITPASEKLVPIDTSGNAVDVTLKEDKKDDVVATTEGDAPVVEIKEEKSVDVVEQSKDTTKSEELEEYSAGVKKRIDKLTKKMREAERREQAAIDYAQKVQEENKKIMTQSQATSRQSIEKNEEAIVTQEALTKQALQQAIEQQDPTKQVEAQQDLGKLAIAKERLKLQKQRLAQAESKQEEQKPTEPWNSGQPQTINQQAAPDPKAEDWAQDNKWFGADRAMTYTAMSFHDDLVNEGFDVSSEDYYSEIDKRIRKEFPHKFEEKSPPKQKVASATRTSSTGRRTVRLTPSQVAIAKKLGVPLEEYAKHVKEA